VVHFQIVTWLGGSGLERRRPSLALLEQVGEEHHDDRDPDRREGEEDASSLCCQVGGMGKVHSDQCRPGNQGRIERIVHGRYSWCPHGRPIGKNGRVTDHETTGLYLENPAAMAMPQWFCTTIASMFGSMAYAIDSMKQNGFRSDQLAPGKKIGAAPRGYAMAVRGDRLVIAQRAKIRSRYELDRRLGADQP